MEGFDFSLVDWSRAQFALTAMFHWLFVPLTLGITFIIAIMESIYVRTGKEVWKDITKFWMKVFGINFAIGVATGLILEFEFGTNWSKYSWFVGDIFGAPLAIEGIMAFFMESTFIAVMFFGWNKVSKRFHLLSSWLTAIGANLSALWILVANAWMQNPQGVMFNPESARNEMIDFWAVISSPTAINKFFHTVSSGYVTAGIVVIGISAWFLIKNRNVDLSIKSIKIGACFGLFGALLLLFTGDSSGRDIAEVQPMKFAAMEGLYEGQKDASLTVIGFVRDKEDDAVRAFEKEIIGKIEIPSMLSFLARKDFVPGINDLIYGNTQYDIMSYFERASRGRVAQLALKELVEAKGTPRYDSLVKAFTNPEFQKGYFAHFGYSAFYDEDVKKMESNFVNHAVPNIAITFYSFRIMVALGFLFLGIFILSLWFVKRGNIQKMKWFLWICIWSIPLVYLASESGWVVAEVGRQPWIIQDLMTTMKGVTNINTGSVQLTFFLFLATFTVLLIAELRIMFKQIKNHKS